MKHQSQPSTAFLQFSGQRRSRLTNSSQKESVGMYSFSFQSTARMKWPSSLRRLDRWDAMKPPAPVTQIFIFLWPSVNFFSATEGRTMVVAASCVCARRSWIAHR